ncbi:TetR/AcrR family transcriptional regulator [Actinomadura scrupuli]|uniref:TetR/AcrR family transcriptional regulator n=1 Tax=Actinomadura scrupuli TaxID=559629 RepID=UPI003D98AD7E
MVDTPPAVTADRALRADAERNRRRILDAAAKAFAERGLEVPLDEIAERAGVGIATLYRRFPSREDLIAAAFADKLAEYAEAAERALRAADPWDGFRDLVEHMCALQAADRGFTDVITLTLNCTSAQAQRDRAQTAFAVLVRRAQDAGVLRDDFVPEDLLLLFLANAGVVQATNQAAPHAWRRLVALMLEAFRADRPGPLPAALTLPQAERAMRDLARDKGVCPGPLPPC